MTPALFATPATAQALGEARAAAILVGGYDGSGNYGDILLLDAALDLVGRLGPNLIALPLLERSFLADHRALAGEDGSASRALFFDPGEGEFEDDLLPVAAPADLAFGACYLYGGGYLNRSWGERKLAMLGAAEALLAPGDGGSLYRISSGLQIEAAWIAELDGATSALRSFDFLSVRDGASADALAALDPPSPALLTGDDAVGVLGRLPTPKSRAGEDRLRINVHFAEHEWVSGRPGEVLDFYSGLIAELGRIAGRRPLAQPLIAYLDRRIDERAAVERLAGACSALGLEVEEPLVLRPNELAAVTPRLAAAELTLSCSYHVALTSLMLNVPAVLLGDTPYYAQKAAGLIEDFELPPAFTTTAGADPTAHARQLAGPVLEDAVGFRRQLAAGADRLRRRRAVTEAELLGRFGGAAIAALDGHAGRLAERLQLRSTEPAELQGRLSQLQTELEQQRHRAGESPLDAELRVQEAEARAATAQEALATMLGSRSWRLAAPLRRLGSLLRRR